MECGGVLGSLVRSDKGRSEERGERKRNREGGRVIGIRVKVSVGVLLHEYSSSSHEQGIGHDKEWFGGIWYFDHQGQKEYFFEFDEHIILFLFPGEGCSLLGQVMERSCECGEIRDKLSVEVAESNEQSDCFY